MPINSAAIQQEILRVLGHAGGSMLKRELQRKFHAERYSVVEWWNIYSGLIREGWMYQKGEGTRSDPIRIVLAKRPEDVNADANCN
jgi:hypothetical protein